MPLILPPGRGHCELACARTFCQWRWGCRFLHLSREKAHWWAWVLLSTRAAEPSRASRAPEQTPVDTAVLPSAAGLAHLPADTVMCARCIPSPARAGGCTECPQSAVSRREPFSQEFLRLRLHFQWHSSFHSEVVLLCHLASSRYRSALLCPKENTATSQLWAMTLLKKWMEKLVLLQYCYTFFLIQSTYFYLTFGLFKPFRIV